MDQTVILPIQLKPSNLRPLAYRVLSKKHGLNIQSGALEILSEYIGRKFGNEWRGPKTISFLEKIAKIWKDQDKGLFVDGPSVSMIINEITSKEEREKRRTHAAATAVTTSLTSNKLDGPVSGENEEPNFDIHQDKQSQSLSQSMSVPDLIMEPKERLRWQEYFKIVPISNYKRFKYNSKRRQFDYTQPPSTEEADAKFNLIELPSTQDTINYFISRLNILKDKLLRNESFQPSTFSSLNSTASATSSTTTHNHQITSIKNLLGRHGQRFVLFGLLTKNSKGLWQLQDESDSIELELTQAIFPTSTCFFVPGNFVIVDGIYSNSGKFYASSMAHPPPERREVSLEALGNMDFTGMYAKNGRIDPILKKKLLNLETKYTEHRFIVLGGDLFLDDLKVLESLQKLFGKLNEETTDRSFSSSIVSIVFNGPFTSLAFDATEGSSSSNITTSGLYKSYFDSLAGILEKFPAVCQNY
ncbi:unnamed protein product [Ambrosiozyma monospora]|uniref:Unnamed protein product n=1 Tax=Ambrosiozyma monospora TaxID=43982 RepID=A0A9W6YPS9_AMBMO|nr:unnamed protein product [Ambrosiozyma monospora]